MSNPPAGDAADAQGFTVLSRNLGYGTGMSSAPTPDTPAPIIARIAAVLNWIGRCVVGAAAALAAYIMVNPAVTGTYGPGAGVFTVSVVGFSLWFASRTAIYIIGGD